MTDCSCGTNCGLSPQVLEDIKESQRKRREGNETYYQFDKATDFFDSLHDRHLPMFSKTTKDQYGNTVIICKSNILTKLIRLFMSYYSDGTRMRR